MLTSAADAKVVDAPTVDELQETISTLQAQLNQAQQLATLGELLSTTTHEFNNILMSVINYTRLGMRQKDEAARQRSLQKVLDASERAAKITNSILGAARNRSSQAEPTALRDLIEDTVILIERELRKYRVQLTQQIDDVPKSLVRGNEIQQVLLNLITNARQALPEGGEITIRLHFDADSGMNELTVRDNGCGISEEHLPKIFEPFFTTKSGADGSGKGGSGLGLAACRDIIEAHHGRIRVASTKGKGTAFTLKLPVANQAR